MTLNKFIPALLSVTALTACSTIYNGPNEARTYEEEHPIMVEQQTITLSIAVDPTINELTLVDKARLRAFTATYFDRGHGAVTITAPSGGQIDFYGQELASDIRQEMHAMGVAWENLKGATYRTSGTTQQADVIISFSNYVASASECGDWSDEFERRWRNISSKNFGCFAQQNLAAMIADPRDLVEPEALGAGDPMRTVDTYSKYQLGQPTSSETDESIDVQAADQ